tara:strand:+ start:727 stop:1071 length:345 start_codon:yes stop_codon:yes gene_type:complete
MKPLEVLKTAAELISKKGNDYQNPNSRVRQANYYPRGCSTILDIMIGKTLRMQSLIEAYENDPNHQANYESLEDSAIDLINYSAFFAAYLHGDIDGQDPDRDFLNRGVKKDGSV